MRLLSCMDVHEARDRYLDELPTIERIIRFAAKRSRLPGAELDDFASIVKLRLLEDDYAVIRKFRGQSRFATYLAIVVQRLLLDEVVRERGRWRPSAEAKRLGAVAVRLEELMHREGLTFDEACSTMMTAAEWEVSRRALVGLHARLPARAPRPVAVRLPREWDAASEPLEAVRPLLERERVAEASRLTRVLRRAIDGLPAEDRLILRLRFEGDLTTAGIARALGVSQKRLYPRVRRILGTLRAALEREGVDHDAARELIAHGIPEFCGVVFPERARAERGDGEVRTAVHVQ